VPGQSKSIVRELANFLEHRDVVGWVLLATMMFFSSLAFSVLENAMSVIFLHRVAVRRRHFLVSALLPYCYILFLGIGLLVVTLVSGMLQAIGQESVDFLGRTWSLGGVSGALLYLLGIGGEIFMLTSIYLVMPVGRLSLRHALIGGHHSSFAMGGDPPRAALVFRHPVAGQCCLRIPDHGDRRAGKPGTRGDNSAAGRPGHLRIRANRYRKAKRVVKAVSHLRIEG